VVFFVVYLMKHKFYVIASDRFSCMFFCFKTNLNI
jgi:hypothetical protein